MEFGWNGKEYSIASIRFCDYILPLSVFFPFSSSETLSFSRSSARPGICMSTLPIIPRAFWMRMRKVCLWDQFEHRRTKNSELGKEFSHPKNLVLTFHFCVLTCHVWSLPRFVGTVKVAIIRVEYMLPSLYLKHPITLTERDCICMRHIRDSISPGLSFYCHNRARNCHHKVPLGKGRGKKDSICSNALS